MTYNIPSLVTIVEDVGTKGKESFQEDSTPWLLSTTMFAKTPYTIYLDRIIRDSSITKT